MKKTTKYFTKVELILWISSVMLIIGSFILFDRSNYLTALASLIGVTSLILSAKGNPLGQVLMIVFSFFYAIISYSLSYYGEMLTYLGMTMPMSAFSLFSWLKHPFKGNRAQVEVSKVKTREILIMCLAAVGVSVLFYFILRHFGTAQIALSTLSVTTSFCAVFLTFLRSPYFAIAYAANDIILILLWVLASTADYRYICVTVCFHAFLVNDIYGFISWRKMQKNQAL